MTKPRSKAAAPHPDDVWRPGEVARLKRRLLARLMQEWSPEVREEYVRQQAADRAAARARRETP